MHRSLVALAVILVACSASPTTPRAPEGAEAPRSAPVGEAAREATPAGEERGDDRPEEGIGCMILGSQSILGHSTSCWGQDDEEDAERLRRRRGASPPPGLAPPR